MTKRSELNSGCYLQTKIWFQLCCIRIRWEQINVRYQLKCLRHFESINQQVRFQINTSKQEHNRVFIWIKLIVSKKIGTIAQIFLLQIRCNIEVVTRTLFCYVKMRTFEVCILTNAEIFQTLKYLLEPNICVLHWV